MVRPQINTLWTFKIGKISDGNMENKLQEKENNVLIIKSEVESKLNILVKGQTNNSKQLQAIRTGWADNFWWKVLESP